MKKSLNQNTRLNGGKFEIGGGKRSHLFLYALRGGPVPPPRPGPSCLEGLGSPFPSKSPSPGRPSPLSPVAKAFLWVGGEPF